MMFNCNIFLCILFFLMFLSVCSQLLEKDLSERALSQCFRHEKDEDDFDLDRGCSLCSSRSGGLYCYSQCNCHCFPSLAKIQLLNGVSIPMFPEEVTEISNLTMQGAYVPLTAEGNIVVSGVLASCHASADHDVAHFSMIPIQWYPEIMVWIFGLSNGFQGYVNIVNDLSRWMPPY